MGSLILRWNGIFSDYESTNTSPLWKLKEHMHPGGEQSFAGLVTVASVCVSVTVTEAGVGAWPRAPLAAFL